MIVTCEAFFLYMQPNFITTLKLLWNPMLVMSLLILGTGVLKDDMDLLVDVLDLFNKLGCLINLNLSIDRFFMAGCNGNNYINWGLWLEPKHV